MAIKRTLLPFTLIDAQSLGASFVSSEMRVHDYDTMFAEIEWIGTSPVGEITVEVASDLGSGVTTGFKEITFGSLISITGNSGMHSIRFDQVPFNVMRFRYTRTSGTGSMSVYTSAKTTGGTV